MNDRSGRHDDIEIYGRLFFKVPSRSRRDLDHYVDLEPNAEWRCERWMALDGRPMEQWREVTVPVTCSCEDFQFRKVICRHIHEVLEEFFPNYPK